MPSEVSDIKQFIEICRRKDAKCTLCELPMLVAVQRGAAIQDVKGRMLGTRTRKAHRGRQWESQAWHWKMLTLSQLRA
jgi:hypothetical protein